MIGNFKVGNTISKTEFSKIKEAIDIITGEKVIIKILRKQLSNSKNKMYRSQNEIQILKSINHQNLLKLYQILEDEKNYYLVTEYANGGTLYEYISNRKKISENTASIFFVQLIYAIEYLESKNIAHRDIKPENLLINNENQLILIDFGLSCQFNNNEYIETPCGSSCYAAPEVLLCPKYNGLKSDIWSCGMVLYAMVCGFLPYDGDNNEEIYKQILTVKLAFPNYISTHLKELLSKLLDVNPNKRPTLEEIKKDAFLNNGITWYKNHFTKITKIYDLKRENINMDIIALMNKYGVKESTNEIIYDILKNKKNNITTIYYLLIQKYGIDYPNQKNNQKKVSKYHLFKIPIQSKINGKDKIKDKILTSDLNKTYTKINCNSNETSNSKKLHSHRNNYIKIDTTSGNNKNGNEKSEYIKLKKNKKTDNLKSLVHMQLTDRNGNVVNINSEKFLNKKLLTMSANRSNVDYPPNFFNKNIEKKRCDKKQMKSNNHSSFNRNSFLEKQFNSTFEKQYNDLKKRKFSSSRKCETSGLLNCVYSKKNRTVSKVNHKIRLIVNNYSKLTKEKLSIFRKNTHLLKIRERAYSGTNKRNTTSRSKKSNLTDDISKFENNISKKNNISFNKISLVKNRNRITKRITKNKLIGIRLDHNNFQKIKSNYLSQRESNTENYILSSIDYKEDCDKNKKKIEKSPYLAIIPSLLNIKQIEKIIKETCSKYKYEFFEIKNNNPLYSCIKDEVRIDIEITNNNDSKSAKIEQKRGGTKNTKEFIKNIILKIGFD